MNLFYYNQDKKETFPIYISEKDYDDEMDILMLSEEKDGKTKRHCTYMKDFNSYMYNKTKHKCRKYFCKRCFQHFISEEALAKHKKDCLFITGKQKTEICTKPVKFNNHANELKSLFVIYADFESLIVNQKELKKRR